MKRAAFFLAVEQDRWTLARIMEDKAELRDIVPPGSDAQRETKTAAAAAALADWGYAGEGICLGLASEMIQSARVSSEGLPRGARYAPLLYRLEEQLPLDAETLTADFLPTVHGSCLGLAVTTSAVQEIVSGLEAVHIDVVAICPTSLLALRDVCEGHPQEPADFVLVGWGSHVDVFALADGVPVSWHMVAGTSDEILCALSVELLQEPRDHAPSMRMTGTFASGVKEAIAAQHPEVKILEDSTMPLEAASATAAKVLADEAAGWVNFRHAGLAQPDAWRRSAGLVKTAFVLGIALLVFLPALLFYRAYSYDRLAGACREKEAIEYHRLYPSRPPQANVRSALESELARMAGVSGSGFVIPDRPSALETLRRITANLPAATRLRMVEMRVGPTTVLVEGETRDHSDAEIIAKSLTHGGFVMDPPRTEAQPGKGVSFILTGKIGPEPAPTPTPAKGASK